MPGQDAECGPTPKNDPSQLPSRLRASRASGVGHPQRQKQIPRARAALGMTTFSDSCDTNGSPSWLLGSCKQENPQGLRQTTSERPGLQPGLKRKKLRRQGEFRDAATGPTPKNDPSQLPSRLRASRASGVGHPKNQKQIPRRYAPRDDTTLVKVQPNWVESRSR
jgi:hypothetical protein